MVYLQTRWCNGKNMEQLELGVSCKMIEYHRTLELSYEILTSHGGCSPRHGPGCCSDLRGRREGGGGDRGRRKALGVSEVRCPVQGWYICGAVVPDCEMTYAMPAKNAA